MTIWPWSKFNRLSAELESKRRTIDDLYAVIVGLDPGYWSRQFMELRL
jgi:hypothetical protein